jgi:hypothetical protein
MPSPAVNGFIVEEWTLPPLIFRHLCRLVRRDSRGLSRRGSHHHRRSSLRLFITLIAEGIPAHTPDGPHAIFCTTHRKRAWNLRWCRAAFLRRRGEGSQPSRTGCCVYSPRLVVPSPSSMLTGLWASSYLLPRVYRLSSGPGGWATAWRCPRAGEILH